MSNNKCGRCRNFDRYYIRGVRRFDKTEFGWCRATGNTVKEQDRCGRFAEKAEAQKSRQAVEACLNNILADISAVRNILEEERQENEEV